MHWHECIGTCHIEEVDAIPIEADINDEGYNVYNNDNSHNDENSKNIDPYDILEFDETYGVVPRGVLEQWR